MTTRCGTCGREVKDSQPLINGKCQPCAVAEAQWQLVSAVVPIVIGLVGLGAAAYFALFVIGQ